MPIDDHDEAERLREALQAIVHWAEAYPVEIFPEPDLKKAHSLLQVGGMTLDAMGAHAMRHVLDGVRKIAEAALADTV